MFNRLVIAVLMVMLASVPALAIDSSKCGTHEDPFHWAVNVTCHGTLELHEMGSFQAGEWVWDEAFKAEFDANNHTDQNGIEGDFPGNAGITVPTMGDAGVQINYGRVDNRAWGSWKDYATDSRFVFNGTISDGIKMPIVWKYTLNFSDAEVFYDDQTCPDGPYDDPTGQTPFCDNVSTFPDDGSGCYPADRNPDCTPQYGWIPEDQMVPHPNTPTPSDFYYAIKEEALPEGNLVMVDANDSQQITFFDIESVTWVEGNQSRAPFYTENPLYWFIGYNASNHKYEGGDSPRYEPGDIYFQPFDGQIPMGDHTFVLNLVGGNTFTINANIASNALMPVVDKYTQGLGFTKIKKNGKSKKKTKNITVVNLTAYFTVNDDGEEILVVQFDEPDREMELTNPKSRLRIWVAEPDILHNWNVGDEYELKFVWMNCPLHTGSIVVPATQLAWIKSQPEIQEAGGGGPQKLDKVLSYMSDSPDGGIDNGKNQKEAQSTV